MDRMLMKMDGVFDLFKPTGPARPGDAGLDLINAGPPVEIAPGAVEKVPCGVSVKIPAGHFGMVVGRSSTFAVKGLLVPTSIIDEGYVGPLYVMVWNPAFPPRVIASTERVAQLILVPYATPAAELVDSLPETVRGTDGFGSTG